jgi:hypothetical protein
MDALDHFGKLPPPEPNVRYILQMGLDIPDGAACMREVQRTCVLHNPR